VDCQQLHGKKTYRELYQIYYMLYNRLEGIRLALGIFCELEKTRGGMTALYLKAIGY
jgi:hypothetical protein